MTLPPKRACSNDECGVEIDDEDEVFCKDCCDHTNCVNEDDLLDEGYIECRNPEEAARDLKYARDAARSAGLNEAVLRIEGVLAEIYPNWQALVVR